MSKVLVTGANGFLGSWVVRKLSEQGHDVSILARKSSDLSELEGLDYRTHYGDVTQPETLAAAFKGHETVFHLAGVIAYKKADRALMEKVNVGGTQNVLDAIPQSDVSKLVYLSSVVAIGAGLEKGQILNEKAPFNIHHLDLGYFETKHEAEKRVKAACDAKTVDAVMLNPSTIYGPGDAKKGSRKTQLKVAQGKFPFYTEGGVNVVDVEDCVAGILSAWKKGRTGERYILAGENLTIQDLFKLIAERAGVPAPTKRLPPWALYTLGWIGDRMTDVGLKGPVSLENAYTSQMYHWFDNSKAKAELGFEARPAREAIAKSVDWMREKGLLNT
ncbi:MAG: NAD-dependent epimerase/dehydratase family protein [Bdellovibrionaceae bacterium]|nr:NAD-dependent epimerase/dehydratase family protein [Pseudobdellovibrionaceae bacterium]